MTTLIFYGQHSNEWMDALNTHLLPHLRSSSITFIEHTSTYSNNKLKMHNTYILPLMEKHMIELHNHKLKAMMPS